MRIREKDFDFKNHTYVMGILNVTPDSFSDGGEHYTVERAVSHALEMEKKGAGIIDIGGESTRPGYEPVSEEEEALRVIPVIKEIRKHSDVVISVDTTKAEVARKALEAGADIINDVSGFLLDKDMAKVAAGTHAPSIIMHDGGYFDKTEGGEYLNRFLREMKYIIDNALCHGVEQDRIIIDPGVGFGKSLEENLIVIKNANKISSLGYPVLLGCSRKSVIGKSLDLPVNERVEGTITTSIVGAMGGYSIFRVHDVEENYRALQMYEKIRDVEE